MGKETKPSSSFTADFLTRAGAVCSVPDDAPWLCESGWERGLCQTLLPGQCWGHWSKGTTA